MHLVRPMKRLHALLERRLLRAVEERVLPGCVMGIADNTGVRLMLPFGRLTYKADAPAVREVTVQDVASVTKDVPVSCLALHLIDQEKLHLEQRLIEYVPELRNASPASIMEAVLQRPFASRPGRFFSQSNATSILLGPVVERLLGESLAEASERMFFAPLGMESTSFNPLHRFAKETIAPTEVDPQRGGILQGEVHDESAWALTRSCSSSSRCS